MSAGVKETREIIQFVVAMTNLGFELAGKNPLGMIMSLGKMVEVLQLAAPAMRNAQEAVKEIADGFSPEEKKILSAEIAKIAIDNTQIDQIIEAALRAGLALSDFFAMIPRKTKA